MDKTRFAQRGELFIYGASFEKNEWGSLMIEYNDTRQLSSLPKRVKGYCIPKAFLESLDSRVMLCSVIEKFTFEEKQVVYYCSIFDTTVEEISERVELSPDHVIGTLLLYAERLEARLDFFKRVMQYDENDVLPLEEMLFMQHQNNNE